ncbi:MAG: SulP family inorganic anion transporter, partial [Magnetococcales bacterium]|nr:SulP family inorganic anion transporter [Magnetococcales bacterium]
MNSSQLWSRLFPFLQWFPVSPAYMRDDLLAGITGALVLVPKAMAYAQLSGLPLYFGLYTAFVPAILGALWGSSRQLATGPVAVVSLMTAAAITPLAVPLTDEFVALALLLTLLVGVIQFGLGVIKLGTIVNFVSHPVILGFMNAAAIIIALSQLDLLLGIPKGRSDSFLKDIWEMFAYLPQTHLPTLAMSILSLVLMLALKKVPLLAKPSVLIVVVIMTMIGQAIDFERKEKGSPDRIATPAVRELTTGYAEADRQITALAVEMTAQSVRRRLLVKEGDARAVADLDYKVDLMQLDMQALKTQNSTRLKQIYKIHLERSKASQNGAAAYYAQGAVPAGVETDGRLWHIKKIDKGEIYLMGGGDVVGNIPAGLPSLRIPNLSLDAILSLFSAALIIALVAFMESISMAKAMAAKSKQTIDPNQELIGQGVANIGGAFFQAYPACGSFTGSAINLQAGAKTGFAMVFNGFFVAITLLFLTPYLYSLPKAVLAVIIVLAAASLITPAAIKHTWQASRVDGMVTGVTFVVTLLAAPHLDKGIMMGTVLSLVLFLYRSMRPRVAILGRHEDGSLRDLAVYPHLPHDDRIIAVRFDGQLYFANVAYFEDKVLAAIADKPRAKYVLVVGDGINQLDSSGEDAIRRLQTELRDHGMVLYFSGLKRQVLAVMHATGLFEQLGGDETLCSTDEIALAHIYRRIWEESGPPPCPGHLLGDRCRHDACAESAHCLVNSGTDIA